MMQKKFLTDFDLESVKKKTVMHGQGNWNVSNVFYVQGDGTDFEANCFLSS